MRKHFFVAMIVLLSLVVGAPSPLSAQTFRRADTTGDGSLNLADVIGSLGVLFLNQPTTCEDALDFNDDGSLSLIDPVGLANFLFLNGVPPAPPFVCDVDPTPDALSCIFQEDCGVTFSYTPGSATYEVGVAIQPNVPSVSGPGLSFDIQPNLPFGLTYSTTTGVIQGTPLVEASAAPYVVTLIAPAGTFTTELTLVVLPSIGAGSFNALSSVTIPRYGQTATSLLSGQVLIAGGSDERFLTSLTSCTVFDALLPGQLGFPPGAELATDFVGNPIAMAQGRIYHSATRLNDGRVLIVGGSSDALIADAAPIAEIFDPATRQITQIAQPMLLPRFHHTATLLPNGNVLLVGGQEVVETTVIDPNFAPGSPQFSFDVTTFPSTETQEIFDVASMSFVPPLDLIGDEITLGTVRGRTLHGSALIAGADQQLGSFDDVVVHAGGFMTFSSLFAPPLKLRFNGQTMLTTAIEGVHLSTGSTLLFPNIDDLPRVGAQLVNLGGFVPNNVQGAPGVSNTLLVTGGDNDDASNFEGIAQSLLLVFMFTGFGPGDGVVAFVQPPSFAHFMGSESVVAGVASAPRGRAAAGAVLIANERFYGQPTPGNWIFTAGGTDAFGGPQALDSTASLFDPFYDPALLPPYVQTPNVNNPSGVSGGWLRVDGSIPDDSLVGYGDGSSAATLNSPRVYHTLTPLPGTDGLLGTADDRILVYGGGDSFSDTGGEPALPQVELFLQP